jgi:iron complex transport system ATP-binding protein
MIARALAQEPSVMLLDEPTSKLDPANRARVLSILTALSASGVTILFTTHDPSLAARIATYLILVREGKILRSGSAEEILTGENLTLLYGTDIKVHTLDGERVVIQR